MYFLALLPLLSLPLALAAGVETEYTLSHTCKRKSQRGDSIQVHYRGTLLDGGREFDTSYKRGQPLTFTVGNGQVIKGWDEGLLDMCPGDKRTLTIPPEFGYGQRATGPIPAGSTLVFETELVAINGVEPEEKVVKEEAKGDKASAPEPVPEKSPVPEEGGAGEPAATPTVGKGEKTKKKEEL